VIARQLGLDSNRRWPLAIAHAMQQLTELQVKNANHLLKYGYICGTRVPGIACVTVVGLTVAITHHLIPPEFCD
jgi:hypothetical protein